MDRMMMMYLVLFPVAVWRRSDWWTWWMEGWKKERDRNKSIHANTPWQTSCIKYTHRFFSIRYLVCLVPAVLVPHSDLGSVIKQRFAAGRVAPCQHRVVQRRQASAVFIVQRRSQRQQSLCVCVRYMNTRESMISLLLKHHKVLSTNVIKSILIKGF